MTKQSKDTFHLQVQYKEASYTSTFPVHTHNTYDHEQHLKLERKTSRQTKLQLNYKLNYKLNYSSRVYDETMSFGLSYKEI